MDMIGNISPSGLRAWHQWWCRIFPTDKCNCREDDKRLRRRRPRPLGGAPVEPKKKSKRVDARAKEPV
jgi:hypothetical protein